MAGVVWKIWYVCALASCMFWLCEDIYTPTQIKPASQLSRVGGISYVFLAGSDFYSVNRYSAFVADSRVFGIL